MIFPVGVSTTLGIISAVALTVVLYIVVLPRRKDGSLGSFAQKLHDFFHFKKLYLEEVLKFLYVLATMTCISIGAFMLLGYEESGWRYITKESTFLMGLGLMVGGPIALRLVYECFMMAILLVKNVIDINNKLSKKDTAAAPVFEDFAPAAPVAEAAAPAEPAKVFCIVCGAKLNDDGTCPNNCK